MQDHVRGTLIAVLERAGFEVTGVTVPDSARPVAGKSWLATVTVSHGREFSLRCEVRRRRWQPWRLAVYFEPVDDHADTTGATGSRPGNRSAGLRRLWRERNFRRLLISQTISSTGDRIAFFTIAVLVTEGSHSPSALGLVFGAQTAALVSFLLIGGVLADRFARHRLMVLTDLVRGCLHAAVATLLIVGVLDLWMLVAIEFVFGAAEACFRPAFSGLVPQTVPEDLIQEAQAVNNFAQNVALFMGPAVAALLVVTVGAGVALVVDALTFGLSALLIARVRPRQRGGAPSRGRLFADCREGIREVRSRPWVAVTILVFSLHLLVAMSPYWVLGPTVASQQYGGIPMWGWVVAAVGLGTTAGSLLGAVWRPRLPIRTGLIAVVPFGALLLLCAQGVALVVVVPVGIISGGGIALFMVWWDTALSERIPPEALGRVSSLDWLGSYGLTPVGYLAMGYLATQVGAETVMEIGGVLALVLPLVALIPRETRSLSGAASAHLSLRVPAASTSG